MNACRDIERDPDDASGSSARNVIAVIGIDRYSMWEPLTNAVSDARGIAALFGRLGFQQITNPLLNSGATGKAIQELVTDDLRELGPDDNLVLFYSGHGGTRTHQLGGQLIKTGYLIPADASEKGATWIELDGWLRAVSLLPARHILVILDACHSGIALGAIIKWRDTDAEGTPLSTLRARRSRRIITSALDDQLALDSGPVHGHSLFTGCLIEGLTRGLEHLGRPSITGSELALYVQRRVEMYPSSQQTPDFGTFDFDNRGEMVIPLAPHLASIGVEESREGRPETMSAAPIARSRLWRLVRFALPLTGSLLVLVLWTVVRETPPPSGTEAEGGAAPTRGSALAPQSCPADMTRAPAGTFNMGSPDGEGDADEHPQHAVTLSSYCIDATEVTVAAYAACVRAGGCRAARFTVQWSGYSEEEVQRHNRWCNREDRADHPMNCVDWNEAAAYCQWARKRLPTEAEWEYAARGGGGYQFPWGNTAPNADQVNACGHECVALAKRELQMAWSAMYDGDDRAPATAAVGTYRDGRGPFGSMDMAGNVWEWTADRYGPYQGAAMTNPKGPSTGEYRVNRGGGWLTRDAGWIRTANRDGSDPLGRFHDLGFRCAR